VQFIKPVKRSRAYFHDIVKPKVPEKICKNFYVGKQLRLSKNCQYKSIIVSTLPIISYPQTNINDNEHVLANREYKNDNNDEYNFRAKEGKQESRNSFRYS